MTSQAKPAAVEIEIQPRRFSDLRWWLRLNLLESSFVHVRAVARRREWQPVTIRPSLASAGVVLVTVVKDERLRIDYLLEYYRRLGVDHFLIIDNESSDGVLDHVRSEVDVSTFIATGEFRAARYAVDWVNGILDRHCRGKWVLWVDADELLVFSADPEAHLHDLVDELDRRGRRSLQTVMIDMYGDRPAQDNVLGEGQDPLEVCRLFDARGYRQSVSRVNRAGWIKGGVRERVFFKDAPASGPALNKTPLVRWRRHRRFMKVAHQLWPSRLNGPPRLGGALLHFKFTHVAVNKIVDPVLRAVHTSEYDAYGDVETISMVDPDVTATYRTPADLVALGIIDPWV